MPNQLERDLDSLPAATFGAPTGFIENWQNALGLAITEDLPITSRLIPSEAEKMREQKLYQYFESGQIPDNVWQYFDGPEGVDFEGLAEYSNRSLNLKDIPTKEDYDKNKLDEYDNYRQMSQEVFNEQNGWGMLGQFAGNMHAVALDPLYAVSFFTGYGAGAGALKTALVIGAQEMAIETAAQPFISDWKDEIGAEYSGAQMVTNVLTAGFTAGGLAGVTRKISMTVGDGKKILDASPAKDSPEVAPIKHVMDNLDSEENLMEALVRDEGITKTTNERGPKAGADIREAVERTAQEIEAKEETTFASRMADVAREGEVERDFKMRQEQRKGIVIEDYETRVTPLLDEASALSELRVETKRMLQADPQDPQLATDLQLINDRLDELDAAVKAEDAQAVIDTVGRLQESIETYKATPDRATSLDDIVKKIDDALPAQAEEIQAAVTRATEESDTVLRQEAEEAAPRQREPAMDQRVMDSPTVRESNNMVTELDDKIKIVEDCL